MAKGNEADLSDLQTLSRLFNLAIEELVDGAPATRSIRSCAPLIANIELPRFCRQPSCPIQSVEEGRWESMAKYPDELKREALNLAAKPGMTVAQVERDLGITPGLIYKWRQRYRIDENSDELKPSAERESEAEIRRLQRELAIAREERDILKKAIQVFSQESKR